MKNATKVYTSAEAEAYFCGDYENKHTGINGPTSEQFKQWSSDYEKASLEACGEGLSAEEAKQCFTNLDLH